MSTLYCSISSQETTQIDISIGLLTDSIQLSQKLHSFGSRFVIITDEIVKPIYGCALQSLLANNGFQVDLYAFPAGEKFKNRQTKEQLEDSLLASQLDRKTHAIALGGGVVLDLAGFIAATYMRGLPLIYIPTSLLAMVDASIGGKVGVNTAQGKNLIGSFYSAKRVFIDPSTLQTLPLTELKNGLAEVIKYALIANPELFNHLERCVEEFKNQEFLQEVIEKSCKIKIEIVQKDPKEKGLRQLLNFGHTIGHALEVLSEYRMSHGQAILIGMLVESHCAWQLGHLPSHSLDRIQNLIMKCMDVSDLQLDYSLADWMKAMTLDKKSSENFPRFVVLKEIGLPLIFNNEFCVLMSEELLDFALNWIKDALCCH